MRKIAFSLALAVGLLGAGAANAWTAQATADINMRSGPGTGYAPLLVIPRGAVVEAGACSRWCQVFFAGYRGFVSARYLAPAGGGGYYQPVPPPVVVVPPPYYRPAPPPYYRPGPPPVYRPPYHHRDRYRDYERRRDYNWERSW
ncbi:SH3 domain-containing protein [Pannonibacter sp. Pt2]|uniref:SH3 domain-containing protein n=1 Tax=Pannonibacter anstelovis TaxID=3121537 RepID=A0ABU7ZRK0_9HYPH